MEFAKLEYGVWHPGAIDVSPGWVTLFDTDLPQEQAVKLPIDRRSLKTSYDKALIALQNLKALFPGIGYSIQAWYEWPAAAAIVAKKTSKESFEDEAFNLFAGDPDVIAFVDLRSETTRIKNPKKWEMSLAVAWKDLAMTRLKANALLRARAMRQRQEDY